MWEKREEQICWRSVNLMGPARPEALGLLIKKECVPANPAPPLFFMANGFYPHKRT
jgi:hypothetical protein